MGITYLSMNMQRGGFLSICKAQLCPLFKQSLFIFNLSEAKVLNIGEAESGLERLHKCAEKELQEYLNAESQSNDFNEFRTKLAGLTSVTKNYFENLVRALENGLSDVDSRVPACSRTSSSKGSGSGSNRGKSSGKSKGSTSQSSGSGRNMDDMTQWSCEHGTCNTKLSTMCAMCQQRR